MTMEISQSDWQLFRKKVPDWQEEYMEKLIIDYSSILNNEKKLASEKFWELESLIKVDKHKPGVIIEMRRSNMIFSIIDLLNDNVICLDDLNEFSDELKEAVDLIRRHRAY